MKTLAELARPGDTVVELGGHIGYLSVHLAKIVGDDGTVIVFEPGPNNLLSGMKTSLFPPFSHQALKGQMLVAGSYFIQPCFF